MDKFCNDCGNLMKEVKRKPMYRADNGKLMGYYITLKCNRSGIVQKLFGHYGVTFFEEIK